MINYRVLEEYAAKRAAAGELEYYKDRQLSRCCTFKIGGPADYAVYPKSVETLVGLIELMKDCGLRFVVLGNASNVLFDDRGYRGAVIFTSEIKAVRREGSYIFAESGASLGQLADFAQRGSLAGLEFAYGIPGTCGGAIYMNAGAYDGEMSFVVARSTYYSPSTGSIITLEGEQHAFGYRESFYSGKDLVILRAELHLNYDDGCAIREKMEKNMRARTEKQPLEYPSAGSVFKRCPGYFTAKLIDEAGLKGLRCGGAQISDKHCGFIVNTGGATAADVLSLVERVKTELAARNGVNIECEIKYIEADASGV